MPTDPVLLTLFTGIALSPIIGLSWRAPATLRLLVADLRPERVLHYDAMVLLGVALQVRATGILPEAQPLLAILGLLVALCYAAVFAIVSNNIEDLAIDRISNARRPLASGAIELVRYRLLGTGFFSNVNLPNNVRALQMAQATSALALTTIVVFPLPPGPPPAPVT